MEKFNLIVKDLETGEELRNLKTNCIIGAVGQEDGIESLTITSCTGLEIELAFASMDRLKKETRAKMMKEAFSKDDTLDKLMRELLKGRE